MSSKRKILIRYCVMFAVVFAAGLITLAVMHAAPFGSNSIAALDMADQYISLYYQRANVSSLQDLFYTWKGALGTNNWATSAYYTNSVFVLFLRHLGFAQILAALDIIVMLKIAAAAVTCLLFLDYKFENGVSRGCCEEHGTGLKFKDNSVIHIGGAAAYALCAWSSAFIQQIMWTDLLFLAPLVLFGLERLLREKKGLLYALFLSLTLAANFYIAYEVCLFLVLYFLYAEFTEYGAGIRKAGEDFLRFALCSILGAAMAAVLLPTAIALGKTIQENDTSTSVVWYRSWSSYLKMLMPGQMNKLWTDGVNISVGILALVFVPLFFFSRRYSLREKIGSALFLALMIVSMNCNVLDYVWHDFHFPRFLPGRWTFLFALFLVILSCKGLRGLKEMRLPWTVVSLLVSAAIIVYAALRRDLGSDTNPFFYVAAGAGAVLILLYRAAVKGEDMRRGDDLTRTHGCVINEKNARHHHRQDAQGVHKHVFALGARNRKRLAVTVPILLAILQTAECCVNFCQVTSSNDENLKYATTENYAGPAEKYNQASDTVAPSKDTFYRTDITPSFTDNPSMLADYYGIGYFCSMMPANSYRFFQWLGLSYYTENISVSANDASPFINSIFRTRYFLDFSDQMQRLTPYLEYKSTAASYRTWENPYILPLGFPVGENAANMNIAKDDGAWGLEHQSALLASMCPGGGQLFNKMDPWFMDTYNTVLSGSENTAGSTFRKLRDGDQETVSLEYSVEKDGPVYLEHNLTSGYFLVSSEGHDAYQVDCWRPSFIYIGNFKAGDDIQLIYNAEQSDTTSKDGFGMELFQMDEDVFKKAYDQLSQNGLEVTDFGAAKVKAKVDAAKQSLYMTSIPQDGGWEVLVDGKKVQTSAICGVLLGFEVPEGEHEVVFRYHVPGLAAGAAVAVLAWAVFVFLVMQDKRKRNLRRS